MFLSIKTATYRRIKHGFGPNIDVYNQRRIQFSQ
jgi:hypothetical protein